MTNKIKNNIGKKDQAWRSLLGFYAPTGRLVFPDGSGHHTFEPAYDYEGQLFALAYFYYLLLIFVFSAGIELLKIVFVKVKKFLAQR